MSFPLFSSLFSTFRAARANATPLMSESDRLRNYERYMRAYRGYAIRAPVSTSTPLDTRRLRHNFNKPIVNLGAAFMAAQPLRWEVAKNVPATQAAFDVWDRSGSDRALLRAARSCGIHGDLVGLATQDAEGRPKIEFVCADLAFPTFDGSDQSRLVELEIAWETEDREGRSTQHREFYTDGGREVFINGEEQKDQAQVWDAIPAVWIRNLEVMGLPYGSSDLDGVTDLVEEYDHLASKRTRIVDYYAAPTIVCEGMKPGDLDKSMQTVLYPPAGSKVYFLEWTGNQPDVESHLTRLRNDLSEISQVPAVAFGRQDSGFSNISGVALRILYGPLLAKTQEKWASWSPGLEYLMWLCLLAEGQAVDLEQVNVQWMDPLPQDPLQTVQAEQAAVGGGLRSVEAAMGRLGAENPKAEHRAVLADQREARLARLLTAKVPLVQAAELVGYGPNEIAVLQEAADQQQAQAAALSQPPVGVASTNGRVGP